MKPFHAWVRGSAVRALPHALLVTLLLAGCSGSDDDPAPVDTTPPPTTPPPTTPPPTATLPPLNPTVVSLDNGVVIGTRRWPNGNTSSGGQGSPIGALTCAPSSPQPVHIHSHLSIFLDGVALMIPPEIGNVQLTPSTDCHYPLHTHDSSGMLHSHTTARTTIYTLGEFFAIWGEPLQRTNVAGLTGLPVTVYVTDAGVARVFTGDDLGSIQLLSRREITIQVGTPITQIPQFTWTGE